MTGPNPQPSKGSPSKGSGVFDSPSAGPSMDPAQLPHANTQKIEQVELAVSGILRWGVLVSMVLILIGASIGYFHGDISNSADALKRLINTGAQSAPGGSPTASPALTTPPAPITLLDLLDSTSNIIVLIGLLILILTPVARVAVSVVAFHIQKDRAYVIITSLVLLLLIFSFVMGYFFDVVVK